MLIDTQKVLRPFVDTLDDELEELAKLIREEQDLRVKAHIVAGAFPFPTDDEKTKFGTSGKRIEARRATQACERCGKLYCNDWPNCPPRDR